MEQVASVKEGKLNTASNGEILEWMFYSGDFASFVQAVEDGYLYKNLRKKSSIYASFAREFDRHFVQILYSERASLDPADCKFELECLAEKNKLDEDCERGPKQKRGGRSI